MKAHTSFRHRIRSTVVAALVVGVALAACGGDDGGDGDGTAAPDSTGTTGTTGTSATGAPGPSTSGDAGSDTTTGSDAAAGQPVSGGELVVGTIFDPFGLEPTTFVGQSSDGAVANALYDNLMTYDENGEPVGWLAESMTTADQQHWTIKLRPGVVFHDGTPLDAEAVKFNFQRHQDPALRSRNLANASKITSMTVVDPLTLELELAHPWASFDEIMIGNLGLMASPTAAQAGTLNEHPVGTGPFTLVERIPGDRVVLERNENYWRDGEPYLDRIVFRVILDDSVRISSVESGEVNAAQSIKADEMTAAEDDGLKATMSPGRANTIYMNTVSGPTADVRVRQGLAQAIDYEALNDVIFDGDAMSEYRIMGSANPFYDASIEFPDYDAEEAARLIEEYEAENGDVSITFRCYTGPTVTQMSQLVAQMWTAAGVDVDVQLSDQGTLVTDMLGGNFQVGCLGTNADIVDPDLLYYNAFYTGATGNYTKYSNPDMDAALDLGRTSNDEGERMEAYRTVQELFARDIPVIEWSKSPGGWVLTPDVNGLVALPGSEFHPSTVWLAED
jgi:peptide/nickel transport system substrate-binding protein